MKARNFLSQTAFWQINKSLALRVGIEPSLLLTELIGREGYFYSRGMLIDVSGEDYFFCTSQQLTEVTTLSYRKQKRCIKTLEDAGMIKTFLRGVPAKVHFSICDDNIIQCVNTSISETLNLSLAKRELHNYQNAKTINNNKEIIINNNNKEIKEKENKNSLPPSDEILIKDIKPKKIIKAKIPKDLQEVEAYFKEKGFDIKEAINFFEYYESNGWKVGKNQMQKWKASASKWGRTAKPNYNNKNEPVSLAKKYFPEMFGEKSEEIKALDMNKVFETKK